MFTQASARDDARVRLLMRFRRPRAQNVFTNFYTILYLGFYIFRVSLSLSPFLFFSLSLSLSLSLCIVLFVLQLTALSQRLSFKEDDDGRTFIITKETTHSLIEHRSVVVVLIKRRRRRRRRRKQQQQQQQQRRKLLRKRFRLYSAFLNALDDARRRVRELLLNTTTFALCCVS